VPENDFWQRELSYIHIFSSRRGGFVFRGWAQLASFVQCARTRPLALGCQASDTFLTTIFNALKIKTILCAIMSMLPNITKAGKGGFWGQEA
jgi:hypothetical protein